MIRSLFVFEGARTEPIIVKTLQNYIFTENDHIATCVFGTDIYEVYRKIKDDQDLDIFGLIKEANEKELNGFRRNDFYGVYLFFDYDAHATLADDGKIREMLSTFDDETEKGKLYISYPMCEALWHIEDYSSFEKLTVKCKGQNCQHREKCNETASCDKEPHYKEIVGNRSIPQLRNINKYDKCTWIKLITTHLCKMNHIVNNKYEFPYKIEVQKTIFESQFNKYINNQCPKVAVLSAFPVFVHDYYGNSKTRSLCLTQYG